MASSQEKIAFPSPGQCRQKDSHQYGQQDVKSENREPNMSIWFARRGWLARHA
jgi:hypothetical protein